MRKHLLRALPTLISLILFFIAIAIIHQILKTHPLSQIFQEVRAISGYRLAVALGLTAISFLLLSAYDWMALSYIGVRFPYISVARASFIGYAFSNIVGHSLFSGGAVRYRFYSKSGLSVIDISKIIIFCAVTFWLGFFTMAGLAFLLGPHSVVEATNMPHVVQRIVDVLFIPRAVLRLLGGVLLLVPIAYVMLSIVRKSPVQIRSWHLSIPSTRLALIQIAIGFLDWAVVGGILYVLLPHDSLQLGAAGIAKHFSYPLFLENFVAAQLFAILSLIPGGLGIFDALLTGLLTRFLPTPPVIASLLAYRAIYYALPLSIGALLLFTHEIIEARAQVRRMAGAVGQWTTMIVPQVLAVTTFMGGVILLFSGATPELRSRLALLRDVIPLPLLESSSFFGSLAGAALLLLARGLQRRLDAAYYLTLIVLAAGALFSLLKGLDYEEATVLSMMFLALLPCHRHFHRRASLISERFTSGWIIAITLALVGSIWLGMFSYEHEQYRQELWYRFSFTHGHAPRFLRATVGAVSLMVIFAVAKLLQPSKPEPKLPDEGEMRRAAEIVKNSTDTGASLALLGDKAFLFSENNEAFIMYGIEGRTWVSLGNPVGPMKEWPELIWDFYEMVDARGGRTVFYEVPPQSLHLYLDVGLSLLKIGEEARVDLSTFSLEGGAHKKLRLAHNKLQKNGCELQIVPPQEAVALMPRLKEVSNAWMAEKRVMEKGFSLGRFEPEYLRNFPMALVIKEGQIIAFANVLQGDKKEELSVDLMRYEPDATRDVMEFLFIELMFWGQREGYRWFNFGMAPLSGLESRMLATKWQRLGSFVFRHGENFYNFQGLRQYKEKFDPVWEPRYIASPGGMALPIIFTNLASLISGGIMGVLKK